MRYPSLTLAAVVLALATAAISPAQAQSLASQMKNFYGFTRGGQVIEKDVTCATTATKVFNSDPSRIWDLEVVTGSNACALGRTGAVTITSGNYLIAPGGSYNETWVDDGFIVGYEMWCICTGGSSNLHVTEQKTQ